MESTEIIIIGAGVSGLMTARELSKAGHAVTILEARPRIGGRISSISSDELGYALEGAAEFVHGNGFTTKALLEEAGLHVVPVEGDYWNVRTGEAKKNERFISEDEAELIKRLESVTTDLPIGQFLEESFAEEKYDHLRNAVTRMVEGYDAGEMSRMSTMAVHDEWANDESWQQGRVVEGYGAMISFLEAECRKAGVKIILNTEVSSIDSADELVLIRTKDGPEYQGQKVIVTVPLPLIKNIAFTPAIPEKIEAVEVIGFGPAMKIFLKFKTEWWKNIKEHDFSTMQMIISNEVMGTWWTQYPHEVPILTGWFAGPDTREYSGKTDEEITNKAVECLSNIFKVDGETLSDQLVATKVMNWPADPFAQGAYSYTTVGAREAIKILSEPVDSKIFFAGEAVYSGKDTGTVEGALASGKEVSEKIKSLLISKRL